MTNFFIEATWPTIEREMKPIRLILQAETAIEALRQLTLLSLSLQISGLPAIVIVEISTSKRRGMAYKTLEELANGL